jgi:NACalpha-BTF3-like transcription factor
MKDSSKMQTNDSMKKIESARMAGGKRVKALNSGHKNKSINQKSIFEGIMAKYEPTDTRSFIRSAHVIDPVTQNKYTFDIVKRVKYLEEFNAFYLPMATILPEFEKCSQDEMKEYSFIEKKVSRSLKKIEEKFKRDLNKANLSNYKMKFNNVTVEFLLDKEIWYQANAEVYQTPNGGYLIYGMLITKWKTSPQDQDQDQDQDQEESGSKHYTDLADNVPESDEELPNGSNLASVSDTDVEFIMQQTNCTREDVIQTLICFNNNGLNYT